MPSPARKPTRKDPRTLESKIRRLKRELKGHKESVEEWESKFVYLQAEFENLKKRSAREREETTRYANRQLIDKLLPILDDLDSAIGSLEENESESAHGVRMIRSNLLELLRGEGLEELECLGDVVDPYKHEVVHTISDDAADDNTVAEVVQKGYVHSSKVIRPSKVVAVRNKEE
jgi:molecular chaperone GrpE